MRIFSPAMEGEKLNETVVSSESFLKDNSVHDHHHEVDGLKTKFESNISKGANLPPVETVDKSPNLYVGKQASCISTTTLRSIDKPIDVPENSDTAQNVEEIIKKKSFKFTPKIAFWKKKRMGKRVKKADSNKICSSSDFAEDDVEFPQSQGCFPCKRAKKVFQSLKKRFRRRCKYETTETTNEECNNVEHENNITGQDKNETICTKNLKEKTTSMERLPDAMDENGGEGPKSKHAITDDEEDKTTAKEHETNKEENIDTKEVENNPNVKSELSALLPKESLPVEADVESDTGSRNNSVNKDVEDKSSTKENEENKGENIDTKEVEKNPNVKSELSALLPKESLPIDVNVERDTGLRQERNTELKKDDGKKSEKCQLKDRENDGEGSKETESQLVEQTAQDVQTDIDDNDGIAESENLEANGNTVLIDSKTDENIPARESEKHLISENENSGRNVVRIKTEKRLFQKIRLHHEKKTTFLSGSYSIEWKFLWGLLQSGDVYVKEYTSEILQNDSEFKEGWLCDCIIDGYLEQKRNHCRKNVVVCPTYFHQLTMMNAESELKHIFEKDKDIEMVLIPLDFDSRHWTLLVFDKMKKEVIYIDPLHSEPNIITEDFHRYKDFQLLRSAVDTMLQWDMKEWPIIEPKHPAQQDSYNCGVFTCVFARRLMNGCNINNIVRPNKERIKIANVIFSLPEAEKQPQHNFN